MTQTLSRSEIDVEKSGAKYKNLTHNSSHSQEMVTRNLASQSQSKTEQQRSSIPALSESKLVLLEQKERMRLKLRKREKREKLLKQREQYEKAAEKLEDQLMKLKEQRENLKAQGNKHEDNIMKENAKLQVGMI